ncbi:MarR family winged helix-turn-helix transcriptional regulator [Azospirillum halopraeferens]|uniref:MarR family winged helix-turn-helix transcriptional regulator n=1 Tax=Azospirillum halopraeferens TaxID=34010 RepID=UPI000420A1CA|nr:MarR family transcriptional regulator [Azospirillum halopraeferens]
MADTDPFKLKRYWPYRLHVLATTVSQTVARTYADRFEITIPEWRIVAVLGGLEPGDTPSATTIAMLTAMDRVQVSRAMARMLDTGLIIRDTGREDRRTARVSLTAKGRAIYDRIVPLARAFEAQLLTALDPAEQAELDRLVTRLEQRAEALAALPGDSIAALIDGD